jgi:hypothetical protein
MIRYNTTTNRYEGYSGSYWQNLAGVQSVDGNTYITPESSPGAGDNIIRFYANNTETAYIDNTKLYATKFQTSQLTITSNTITGASNTDININTVGTGGVVLGNLRFTTNKITNTTSDAITQFTSTGSGYFAFGGTFGVVIPVGNTSQRPISIYEQTGMIRYNTDVSYVEIYTGSSWESVAGSSSGVTSSTAQDIGVQTALALG